MRDAITASSSAAASVSMCPASASSASELREQAGDDLGDHERDDDAERGQQPAPVGLGRVPCA